MFRYYSTQRPVLPGSFPQKGKVEEVKNFETKTFCEEIGRDSWGYIDYKTDLTKVEADSYELTPGGMKTHYCVVVSIYDHGVTRATVTGSVQDVNKPDSSFVRCRCKGVWKHWFDSLEDAEKFATECGRF